MWRYLAFRLNGDGTEDFLAGDLPLTDVTLGDVLSGVDDFTATVPVDHATLADASQVSRAIFVPWSTAIYAEKDGRVRGGFIITDVDIDGENLKLTGDGFTGYPHGIPYVHSTGFVNTDPLDIARHIWDHIQGQDGGDLGVTVVCDPASSPIRLGKLPVEQWPTYALDKTAPLLPEGSQFRVTSTNPITKKVATLYGTATRTHTAPNAGAWCILRRRSDGLIVKDDTGAPAGWDVLGLVTVKEPKIDVGDGETLEPYRLDWFADADLGARFDDLATQGQFDYRMEHAWVGDTVQHTLRIAYGGLGARRDDLRFVVGENVQTIPTLELSGEDFASGVMLLGAGEGRAMIRGSWTRQTGRLRRPKVITDKSIRTVAAAQRAVESAGRAFVEDDAGDIRQLVVRDHPNAPLGSWQPGDTIHVVGARTGWAAGMDMWVRVLSTTTNPATDVATLTVTRTEKGRT